LSDTKVYELSIRALQQLLYFKTQPQPNDEQEAAFIISEQKGVLAALKAMAQDSDFPRLRNVDPQPQTLNPILLIPNPNPKPQTQNPNLKPYTLNPQL